MNEVLMWLIGVRITMHTRARVKAAANFAGWKHVVLNGRLIDCPSVNVSTTDGDCQNQNVLPAKQHGYWSISGDGSQRRFTGLRVWRKRPIYPSSNPS